ncbi:MAG: ATP-binding protein, partial [Candidatus Eisenbacteria bacterium]|nr:ATP-binding protein [Candidatus Eisenbacteria bacterium]
MQEFEKLGAFYLGKTFDHDTQDVTDETILYDAKDLTTHAVCVGMTGSGKTGLCLSLLEEAAIDGIPTLAIDPKGDLGNLLLTFPNLAPKDFEPWIDPGEATRKGNTVPEHAKKVSALWKNGLASWGQDGKRIKKFRDAVDLTIFTPGSNAGVPISILKSFNAPSEAVREDGDLFRDRVKASVSGLLALLGIDADPLQSREHILLSNIVQAAWTEGKDLDLASLIREIQAPPFDRIGVMDLDSFYPSKDRFALAMTLNNLLASPGFASWMEGQPLDIQQLLWTPEGKPRIAILSIAHLSESERMFVVTLILNEMLSWVRSQAGTTSLRALLYMDEVFGYFPPTKNPPSKTPMLTLLKQARAFGLGVVLATQNPVDLDYKGLSNTGTWFLGRLQTERDKMRVLDGLEGASAAAGAGFDRSKMESILSGLKSRVFLLNNVHENEPVLFHTRWVLSYLRGPLTRQHIQKLMKGKVKEAAATQAAGAPKAVKAKAKDKAAASRPVLPPEIEEKFIPRTGALRDGEEMVYRPQLMADTRLHFTKAGTDLDHWYEETLLAPIEETGASWEASTKVDATNIELEDEPEERGSFGPLPGAALKKRSYSTWEKKLKSYLYRERTKSLWKCKALKENS